MMLHFSVKLFDWELESSSSHLCCKLSISTKHIQGMERNNVGRRKSYIENLRLEQQNLRLMLCCLFIGRKAEMHIWDACRLLCSK